MDVIVYLLVSLGPLINRSLSAAIAIISGSFFLYSLAKDIGNRVARTFSTLLLFVTITYIGDLGVSYSYSLASAVPWLTFQWLGIAFAPAAYVHLSDAILTMTGLPSRGRRRWAVRFLYVVAVCFLVLVVGTEWIVRDPAAEPAPHFRPGPAFIVFVAYFVGSVVMSVWFVIRARRRTLTQASHRRMTYLLISYAAPALAVFPFLLISGQSLASPGLFYGMLILVDTVLAVLLSLMAYVLAFFGTLFPDRLVKAQMLQFFLRGPVVAIAALAVIVWVPRTGDVLGLPGDDIMSFLAVVVILFLQWAITLARPHLERWLIYMGNQAEIRQIQELESRLLTGADFRQLLDSILTATCDYLRVRSAFVASLTGEGPRLEQAVGLRDEFHSELERASDLSADAVNDDLPRPEDIATIGDMFVWRGFWLIPLHAQANNHTAPRLIGVLGVAAPEAPDDEEPVDEERRQVLMALATRAAEVLEDRRLQSEVFAALEGLLPEMAVVQRLGGEARYGGLDALTAPREELLSSPDFTQKVKDALSHYWGGPKLTDNALMDLTVVRQALEEHDGNPQRAMRAVLQSAIENLRPEGQRSMTTTEWILYNILEMRFIQGRKVRDVAMRLAMSEADFYRKQRFAIESVAAIIAEMERATARPEDAPDESGQP
jgi:hypothetical protein